MKPIAILQHDPWQRPGDLLEFLDELAIPCRVVRPCDGDEVPRTARFRPASTTGTSAPILQLAIKLVFGTPFLACLVLAVHGFLWQASAGSKPPASASLRHLADGRVPGRALARRDPGPMTAAVAEP